MKSTQRFNSLALTRNSRYRIKELRRQRKIAQEKRKASLQGSELEINEITKNELDPRGKSWIGRIKEFFQRINKLVVFLLESFFQSFAFSIIKALICVLLLALLVYSIKPYQAHIYMVIEKTDQLTPSMETSFSAETISCSGLTRGRIVYTVNAEIVVEGHLLVNGIHDPHEILVLRPNPAWITNNSQYAGLILEGDYKQMLLGDASSVRNSEFFAKNITVYGTGDFQVYAGASTVYVENTKDPSKNREVDVYSDQIVFSDDFTKKTAIQISTRNNTEEDSFFATFACKSIDATHVTEFQATVTGNATVSYTSTGTEYALQAQEVSLENKNTYRDLNLQIVNTATSEGTLFGYVTDGTVSLSSIFPSFRQWLFTLAPTALITVVLSAVSIFMKKKK